MSDTILRELAEARAALQKCADALMMLHGEDARIDEAYTAAQRVLSRYTRPKSCLEVLRALAEYTGGSDTAPGHPCREAWEYLNRQA